MAAKNFFGDAPFPRAKKPAVRKKKQRLRPHFTATVAPETKAFFEGEWPARTQSNPGCGLDVAAKMLKDQTPPPPEPKSPVDGPTEK